MARFFSSERKTQIALDCMWPHSFCACDSGSFPSVDHWQTRADRKLHAPYAYGQPRVWLCVGDSLQDPNVLKNCQPKSKVARHARGFRFPFVRLWLPELPIPRALHAAFRLHARELRDQLFAHVFCYQAPVHRRKALECETSGAHRADFLQFVFVAAGLLGATIGSTESMEHLDSRQIPRQPGCRFSCSGAVVAVSGKARV